LGTSISSEEPGLHFSRRNEDTVATNHTSLNEEETFHPAFLGEARVIEALRRAGDLFQQRHGLNGATRLAPPLSDWGRVRAMHGPVPPSFPSLESESSSTFAALLVPSKATIRGYADASYAPRGTGVHAKFVPGNESASVIPSSNQTPQIALKRSCSSTVFCV
jgi:hypothetical protein